MSIYIKGMGSPIFSSFYEYFIGHEQEYEQSYSIYCMLHGNFTLSIFKAVNLSHLTRITGDQCIPFERPVPAVIIAKPPYSIP